MPDLLSTLRRGLRLPPAGWVLAAMLAFYVLAGLFGRDPWKGEDAIHIGVAWHMLHTGDWLAPELAGRAFHAPPLYYWSAALSGHLFGWLLPTHEAMRLASGFWVMLALVGLYYAGRELYGQDSAAASPLLLAGSLGLILHAHDAQPMLIAVAAYSGTLGALAAIGRRPRLAGLFYGLAVAGCLLGAGIAPTLPLLAILPLACWLAPERNKAVQTLLIGLTIAVLLTAPWPLILLWQQPDRFHGWLVMSLAPLMTPLPLLGAGRFLTMLPWFAFPALPLALWTLWSRRQQLAAPAQLLPLAFLLLTLLMLALAYRPGEIPALLLLPPLALLATPGALLLRRGAANAFDWFAMTTFSFFAAVVWLGWSAMALGWPARLAQRVVILRPGFVGQFDLGDFLIGLGATLWWAWLIVTAPRSPYRSLTHWTLGFTTLWLLLTTLILPWFDYGRSYRPVAEAVAAALPEEHGCLAERGLTNGQRASLAYFSLIEPAAYDSQAGKACAWLLLVGETPAEQTPPAGDWKLVWKGLRPGERHEKFLLFRR
ncbi:MAG: glycosyltransferase family 39 protein [Azonexus sp.]|jgi:4-amino-4-deoxy-L-arabinose transferase-like glycosyltransferase|uniref:ArnT family glycosyltransferase n=1 Tax=Azonexus sp. TaxID=1872668 RepID=UPI002816DE41|nr:glycosyltransferase family 39 protein [Azonexus sp.]MDR0776031.1 glycosyltransferase family 39 protein [Azonexus sp.]